MAAQKRDYEERVFEEQFAEITKILNDAVKLSKEKKYEEATTRMAEAYCAAKLVEEMQAMRNLEIDLNEQRQAIEGAEILFKSLVEQGSATRVPVWYFMKHHKLVNHSILSSEPAEEVEI